MNQRSHYPSFNVLDELDAWDDHTQSIVNARLSSSRQYSFLNGHEAELLSVVCALLMNDSSPEIMAFVVQHIDETLQSPIGESQRKAGIPSAQDLVREGLQSLDSCSENKYSAAFLSLDPADQKQIVQDISQGYAKPVMHWNGNLQQAFFQKLMTLTIEAYCSHPKVWSDIGYAGPAYPRGYVRTEIGQLDPWEAKAEQP